MAKEDYWGLLRMQEKHRISCAFHASRVLHMARASDIVIKIKLMTIPKKHNAYHREFHNQQTIYFLFSSKVLEIFTLAIPLVRFRWLNSPPISDNMGNGNCQSWANDCDECQRVKINRHISSSLDAFSSFS